MSVKGVPLEKNSIVNYRKNTLGFSLEYTLVTTVNYRNYYSFYYSNITRVYFSENPIVFYSISYCSKL